MTEYSVNHKFDVMVLASFVRAKQTPFGDGAFARCKGIPLRLTDVRWMNGWKWANRVLLGLEAVHGSEGDSVGAGRIGSSEDHNEEGWDDSDEAGSDRASGEAEGLD